MVTIPCGNGNGNGIDCQEPCNCLVADDGVIQVGDSYLLNTGRGRRNTVVAGQGTVNDPYTVSFIDSEFFRPESAEFNYPNQSVTSPAVYTLLNFSNGAGTIVYETPHSVIFRIESGGLGDFAALGFFQFVGASVEFASNTTGSRKIVITHDNGTLENVIAGYSVDAPGESMVLSTAGFFPGHFSPTVTHPVGFSSFRVRVSQDSGSTLALTNIKFWVGSL